VTDVRIGFQPAANLPFILSNPVLFPGLISFVPLWLLMEKLCRKGGDAHNNLP
jgi:hypothetical protein